MQVSVTGDELKLTLEGAELPLSDNDEASITTEDQVSYIKIPLIKAGDCL